MTSFLPDAPLAHASSIALSHQRCTTLGLDPANRPQHVLARPDDLLAPERNRRLHLHAVPVMELLLDQIQATHSMVALTDAQGSVLHSVGYDDFLRRPTRIAFSTGVNWSEAVQGTNAIGTALVTEAPTCVHGNEHYLRANHALTCSATPIFDSRGDVLGVLDVTGDQRSYHAHTMGLVKMSARMIENHWLTDHFQNELLLQIHTRPECLGTLMEALIAVGQDGCILGSNRAALSLFGASSPALRRHTVGSLLGTSLGALVTQFRRGLHGPMQIILPTGKSLFVQARFSWHNWYALGHLQQPPTVANGGSAAEAAREDGGTRPAAAVRTETPAVRQPVVAESDRTLHALELHSIRAAIHAAHGNVSLAARQLGVSRNTIYRRLRAERSATDL